MLKSIRKQISKLSLRSDSEPRDSDCEIRDSSSILAFSTIATMLSYNPRHRGFNDPNLLSLDSVKQRDLDFLSGMATVLVINHEVVAVARKVNSERGRQILFVTANARDGKDNTGLEATARDAPAISDPSPPSSDMPDFDIPQLETHIDTKLPSERFAEHVWMVSKFFSLLRERQYDVMVLFYRYVIATCFRKILYRLQHSISRPFFTSVTGVSIFKFPEHPQTPCSPSELQRDSDFLTAILSFETENPIPNLNEQAKAARDRQPFKVYTEETHIELHTLLCELLKRFESSLETLAGYHSVTGSSGDYQRDLHATANIGYVLFRLARSAAIEKHFKAIESSLADRRRDKTKDVKLEEIKKEFELGTDFYDELDAELYNEHFGKMDAEFKALNTEDAEKDEEDAEEDEEDAEEDEEDAEEDEEDAEEDEEDSGEDKEDTEARGGQPSATWKGSSTPALWHSYLDWLRLMVVHFEAVWTLANRADDDKFDTIFRIVYPPDVTSKMLSWRQLLSSPHFPNSVSSMNVANRSTSDIVAYLEASVLERGAVQHIIDGVKAFDKPEASLSSTVSIIQAIKKLPFLNCQSPTWNTYAERIFSALKLLEEVDPSESHCLLTLIVQMLEVVRDNTALLHQLNQQKLHSGDGFDAPVHCELVLGSLISRSRTDTSGEIYDEYKVVLDELKGTGSCVGVSRRCCPVCAYMLHEMPTGGGESFVARPSHSTISACALPIWLPEAVVKKGNQAFGSQLRQELIEMMSPSPDSLVESRKSSDSQDLPLSDFAKASLAEKVNTSYRIGGVLKKGRNDVP